MKNPFNFEAEQFEFDTEFDEYEEGQSANPCQCHQRSRNDAEFSEEYQEERSDPYSEFGEEFEGFDTEMADLEWEEELRGRQRIPIRPRTPRFRSVRRRRPPIPPRRLPRRPPGPIMRPRPRPRVVFTEPAIVGPGPQGREYVRWVQSSLNQIMGLRLPVNGIMGPETRSAIRTFQERQGLPADGIAGPDTERALIAARAGQTTGTGDKQATEPSDSQPPGPGDSQSPEPGEFEAFDTELDGEWWGEVNQPRQGARAIARPAKEIYKSQSRVRELTDANFWNIFYDSNKVMVVNFWASNCRPCDGVAEVMVSLANRYSTGRFADLVKFYHVQWESQVNPKLKTRFGFKSIPVIFFYYTASGRAPTRTAPLLEGSLGGDKRQYDLNEYIWRIENILRCRGFFAEYDLRFEPTSSTLGVPANTKMTAAEKARRIADVNAMVPELLSRRDRRAIAALAGRVLASTRAPSALIPVVRRLSDAQLELYREFFPDGAGAINFGAFQHCFEKFANGELRNQAAGRGVGEPNGGFYFLFAEFAFLCIDSEIDAATWIKALSVFVKTQEIFMHVYRLTPTPPARFPAPPAVWGTGAKLPSLGSARRSLDDFVDTNFNATGQSNASRKAALRKKYDRMGLNSLRKAALDNMLRAQRMP